MKGLPLTPTACASILVIATACRFGPQGHREFVARGIRVTASPPRIAANGSSHAEIRIEPLGKFHTGEPRITVSPTERFATVERIESMPSGWVAHIRAGVQPGVAIIRVNIHGETSTARLEVQPDWSDTAEDGTPDFLRLTERGDQQAFRRWFTFLAEQQYFLPRAQRPEEISDCAALLRYAYREALRKHDARWAHDAHLFLVPAMASVERYSVPFTPVGASVFRIRSGTFQYSDVTDGAFAEFADVQTLIRFNTHRLSDNIRRAQPGDLLFYRRSLARASYHSMIFNGRSQIEPGPHDYVVYHTGPEHGNPGEIRRLTISDLLNFPDAQWRPLPSNDNFLGVYRWNILRDL